MQSRVKLFGVALCALALLVGGLFIVPLFNVAAAADAPGLGPDNALPGGEWVDVAPGQSVWYAFDYDFLPDLKCKDECTHECRVQAGHDKSKDCQKECDATCHVNHMTVQPMQIELFSNPKTTGLSFCVMTAENVKVWKETGKVVCTGQGSKNDALRSQLSWSGFFLGSGKYYVLVRNPATAQATASERLLIGGAGVLQ